MAAGTARQLNGLTKPNLPIWHLIDQEGSRNEARYEPHEYERLQASRFHLHDSCRQARLGVRAGIRPITSDAAANSVRCSGAGSGCAGTRATFAGSALYATNR